MSNLDFVAEGKPADWVPLGDTQKVVSPEEMFFKLPRKTEFITGSEAARESIRRMNVDVAIAYPITPQSETMQQAGYLYDEGYIKDFYRGEEEIGVMSAVSGASRAGVRTLTATSGPGLMRGMEAISFMAGSACSPGPDEYVPGHQHTFGDPAGQHRNVIHAQYRDASTARRKPAGFLRLPLSRGHRF